VRHPELFHADPAISACDDRARRDHQHFMQAVALVALDSRVLDEPQRSE
jgi:hypothetical protein